MLLPDITDLLDDPEVGGGQAFVILRRTSVRRKGREGTKTEEKIPATGSVQPAGESVLEQLPEADRDNDVRIFRTTTPIQMGHSTGEGATFADEIEYNGEYFKVLRDKKWAAWGMYVAFATKIDRKAAAETPGTAVEEPNGEAGTDESDGE